MRHIVVVVLSLAVTAAVVWAVPPLHGAVGDAFSGDVDALRDRLTALGAWGAVVVVALILVHAVVFFPAEIVNAAAGLALGFGVALPLVLVAWGASGLIAYWLGARAGRPLAVRVASEARVARVEELLERGGAPMLLSLRLIPFVPFSLLGYVAGAARVPVWRYTWTSVRRDPADHRGGDLPGPRAGLAVAVGPAAVGRGRHRARAARADRGGRAAAQPALTSTTASTAPVSTCEPACTRSSATVPAAGARPRAPSSSPRARPAAAPRLDRRARLHRHAHDRAGHRRGERPGGGRGGGGIGKRGSRSSSTWPSVGVDRRRRATR